MCQEERRGHREEGAPGLFFHKMIVKRLMRGRYSFNWTLRTILILPEFCMEDGYGPTLKFRFVGSASRPPNNVPQAAIEVTRLYELLVLVDIFRDGQIRELQPARIERSKRPEAIR
jgi:hypothetical protein